MVVISIQPKNGPTIFWLNEVRSTQANHSKKQSFDISICTRLITMEVDILSFKGDVQLQQEQSCDRLITRRDSFYLQ